MLATCDKKEPQRSGPVGADPRTVSLTGIDLIVVLATTAFTVTCKCCLSSCYTCYWCFKKLGQIVSTSSRRVLVLNEHFRESSRSGPLILLHFDAKCRLHQCFVCCVTVLFLFL